MIDTNTAPNCQYRPWAEKLMADLKRDNPAADWRIFVEVKPADFNTLERLYALTCMLLDASKVNVLAVQLSVGDVGGDNTAKEYSVVEIMNAARATIDRMASAS